MNGNLNEAYDYTDRLLEVLTGRQNIVTLSVQFKKLSPNAERVRFNHRLIEENDLLPKCVLRAPKSNERALEARKRGNDYFVRSKDYPVALECYNESLAFAEVGSEHISIAYANRSAIYLKCKLYQCCLQNIEAAFANGYPEKFHAKLEKRRQECLEQMNNLPVATEEKFGAELKLSYEQHPKLPFIANALEYAENESFGRYIVTNRDLTPGDIVIIEKPFSKILLKSAVFKRCTECLTHNFLNLFPCHNCTKALFCSENCRNKANKRFHNYECPIIDALFQLFTKIMLISIRTALISLTLFDQPNDLEQFLSSVDVNKMSAFNIDYTKSNEKQLLSAIHALATNESQRTVADLFQRVSLCAIAWDLLYKHTDLPSKLSTYETQNNFLNILFRYAQAAAVNYHSLAASERATGLNAMAGESYSSEPYGSGSFAVCSLLNHSCAPNVVRFTSENHNVVMVNRVIRKGEQLFDSYGPHHCLDTLPERQKTLTEQYLFSCSCEACKKNYPLYANLPPLHGDFDAGIFDALPELQQYNREAAKKYLPKFVAFLLKYDKKYPSCELSTIQEYMLRCSNVLMRNLPIDFVMKENKN